MVERFGRVSKVVGGRGELIEIGDEPLPSRTFAGDAEYQIPDLSTGRVGAE